MYTTFTVYVWEDNTMKWKEAIEELQTTTGTYVCVDVHGQ